MKTKQCTKCKKIKSISEFSKDKQSKDKHSYYCKVCQRARGKIYYQKNAEKVIKQTREYLERNKEKMLEWKREYSRKWYIENQEHIKEYSKKYYEENKSKERERSKRFFENNPDYRKNYSKKWKENNPDYEKEWLRNKREIDPAFRLSKNLGRHIRESINRCKGGYHWEDLLGFTLQELKEHLEKQFKSGMTWNNYGIWHIDHIRPISSFSFNSYKDKEFKECWALSNLQPLWAEDNLKKGNKLIA
jgi:hypothetical protein